MKIQRIQWAGILIESQQQVIMIDPVFNGPNFQFFGNPKEPFYDLTEFKTPNYILITHLHSDHFDPKSIMDSFGKDVPLLVPNSGEKYVRELGFTDVRGLEIGESISFGDIEFHALFSVDGLGDDQVTWVIKTENKNLLHGGDTLWHGKWWKFKEQYGPFEVVFLPINGPIVKEDGMTDSNLPICMNPEQALAAATILDTKILVPIHYGAFHNPPTYIEWNNPIKELTANEQTFKICVLQNKEEMEI